ncbi:L-aminopeptidase/D-esterase-like protein [Kribbella sp. VKM Ac-2571]|uniref:P1 family peptidase n=1 Tax=Kribbella sp. VKM Ac-2571 TaxID=2512222 RepID=UPI00105C76A5|nr:P1 family peptidase [Kribbella sp. VKM Ac-2571]TDO51124.1 L-aminopeptidase/D-esterase-like protein [Kribbella sp. VKM Ac-2571]
MTTFGVPGVRVGHWSDFEGRTGCTVVDLPAGTVASYEARGGAPASRELELLEPGKAVNAVDGVVLTGGSAFGLAAADGVMRFYREQGRGVQTPAGAVPIVPTLALFDLTAGDPAAAPDSAAGYAAAQACTAEQVLQGQVGAGTGAYVGHWRGPDGRRPGGLGYAEHRLGELVVACLAVVNAFGDVDDGGKDVSFDAVRILAEPFAFGEGRAHTTIGIVVTNARLDKVGCRTVAQGAHDGLARSITPPHTQFDGDGFVAAATGQVDMHVDIVRLLALACVADAVRSVGSA